MPRHANLALVILLLACCPLSAIEYPKVKVTNVRRVFHNGEHNAFTDLVQFQGKFYLTFRSCPDGHMVHPTASVIILSSDDGRSWKQVHRFRVRHRDTRDPHFVVFKEKLFVYTGTWYSGATTIPIKDYDLNKHLGYAAWTADGTKWLSPIMLDGTFGHYIWRAATFGGKVYLCGRRKIEFDVKPRGEGRQVESLMLESDDGLIFRKRAVFQPIEGDETAFLFNRDGSIIAIGRRGSKSAQLLKSKSPYTTWQRSDIGRYIGGPLITRWGQRLVVGGRKRGPKCSMYWLDGSKLREFAELPSGGDTSYPGFIALSPTKALMSWYSSHEKKNGKQITAIYLADLEIDQAVTKTESLRKSLLLHASFDRSGDADYARGDAKIYTSKTLQRKKVQAGLRSDGVKLDRKRGKYGGSLVFTKKTSQIVFFKGAGNLPTVKPGFQGTYSFWLKLSPAKDLPPGFVDPLQITDKKWNDASFFVDFTKKTPRQFRLGVFSNFRFWNPSNRKFDSIPEKERPLVSVSNPPFSRQAWTHIGITFQGFNQKEKPGVATFYLNGKSQGQLKRKQLFTWNKDRLAIMLGIYYVGQFDDFAIFDRALTAKEIGEIYRLPKGIRSLR